MNLDLSKQVVHTTSLFEMDDEFTDERFCKVRIAAMHSGKNKNGSSFSTKVIKEAKDSFANIPILADIQEFVDDDGNTYLDYTRHSMHIEDDKYDENAQKIIYDEKVVGIIPETNDFEIIHDDENDRDVVYVTGLIYRDYGNYCYDILKSRGGKTDVSMEIACDDISYSASDKVLEVGKMQACGLTLLGEDVSPGMYGANAQMFCENKASNREEQLIKIMQELKESLDNYTAVFAAKDTEKGGNEVFEKLLEQYGKTVEDITFEYEGLSDEELTTAFAEAFATNDSEGETSDTFTDDTTDDTDEDDAGDATPEPEPEDDDTDDAPAPAPQSDEDDDEDDTPVTSPDTDEPKKIVHSVTVNESTMEFSVSLSDIMYALSSLVNETYCEDGYWYDVDVYADEKYVIMSSWSGVAYKQSYKVKKDSYSLVGDRVPVKAVWCTSDEEAALDKMRSNYEKFEEVSDKLSKYESEPEKTEILDSKDYQLVAGTDEFLNLKKQENHFDLSVDEVKEKANSILLDYAKKGSLNFAAKEDSKASVTRKNLGMSDSKSKKRYGNMFPEK